MYQKKKIHKLHKINAHAIIKTVGRNKRTVWKISTKPYKEAHFATYPPDLIQTPIKAGCPEGGIVLDPFIGSGTTAIVAIDQGKQCIGIQLNQSYCEIAKNRIEKFLNVNP